MAKVHVKNIALKNLKHMNKKGITEIKSVKEKALKRRYKKNISDDAFKNTTLYKNSLSLTQKQIKSKKFHYENGRCRKRCYSYVFK